MIRKSNNLADALPHTPRNDQPPPLPCRTCSSLTARATLATHGGQCYPCFAHWCRYGDPECPREPDSPTVVDMKTRLRRHIGAAA